MIKSRRAIGSSSWVYMSRPDLDRPPAAINARTKEEGHVTSRIGNGRTTAMVH